MSKPPKKPVRILVVDDSAFMRKAISMMLESDVDIRVIGSARDGEEGVAKVMELKPDLVTMDVEMPRMDGLTALKEIMAGYPVPVMMVSSSTSDGARATLDALELGAVDFIPKRMSYSSLDVVKIRDELIAKIKKIASHRQELMTMFRQRQNVAGSTMHRSSREAGGDRHSAAERRQHRIDIVAVGSSTGGPPALQTMISALPRNLPVGVLVVQHMPPMFTKSLAERLNSVSHLDVREAVNGDTIDPGSALVAPGGKHLRVRGRGRRARVVVSNEPANTLYKPCVDVMMTSVASAFGQASMGVVLTGMGSDGLVGSRNIKQQGGVLIAQDQESCVVYGMPKAVIEAKLTDHVASIDNIAAEIASYF